MYHADILSRLYLQEFCCSNRLEVVTEPSLHNPMQIDESYIAEDEEFFSDLRERVQLSMQHCKPYWLRAGGDGNSHIPPEQTEEIRAKYRQLSARTFCHDPVDKPRALCPMLTNTPVETHRELIDLVRQLRDQNGEPLDPEAEQLLVQEEAAASRQNTMSRPASLDSEESDNCEEDLEAILAAPLAADLPGQCPDALPASAQ
eukprot:scaffold47446_cov20-Prasinocladus_malaysianus.AAC.1